MGRIRICQLITELAPAGAERCVYEIVRRIDRDRFDVQVAALRGGPMVEWFRDLDVPVSVIDVRSKTDVLRLGRLVRLLRDERIDLLHTHLFHADMAGRVAGYLAGVKHLVHTVHVAEGRVRPWQFAFARLFSDLCDRIVCVSDSVEVFHSKRSGMPASRYRVIPNGIEAGAYVRNDRLRQRLRRRWGIGDDEMLLTFVGRLDRQKGIDTLLGALSHLAARREGKKIVMAGDGPMRDMVTNWVEHGEGGRLCRMLGFVKNVQAVLSAADVLVLPSRWEGFGLVASEAMAAGLPVVGTHVAGLRDVVVPGRTGLLVEPEDAVALVDAIETLAQDRRLRERMGAEGKRRALGLFDINANVATHEALYEEIVTRS